MQYFFLQASGRLAHRRVPRPARRAIRQKAAPGSWRASAAGRAWSRVRSRADGSECPRPTGSRRIPVRLLEIFTVADAENLELHPDAMRLGARDARLVDAELRRNPRANALFAMDLLTSRQNPEAVLRWLNEVGRVRPLCARFRPGQGADAVRHVPSLHGRRAYHPRDRLTPRIDTGELKDDHPLPASLFTDPVAPRALSGRCCCMTSPRAGRRPLGARGRDRVKLAHGFGLDPGETELLSGWCGITKLVSDTAMSATWRTGRRTTISSAPCGARSGYASRRSLPWSTSARSGRGVTAETAAAQRAIRRRRRALRLGHISHGRTERRRQEGSGGRLLGRRRRGEESAPAREPTGRRAPRMAGRRCSARSPPPRAPALHIASPCQAWRGAAACLSVLRPILASSTDRRRLHLAGGEW